jgi:hypothetical protein
MMKEERRVGGEEAGISPLRPLVVARAISLVESLRDIQAARRGGKKNRPADRAGREASLARGLFQGVAAPLVRDLLQGASPHCVLIHLAPPFPPAAGGSLGIAGEGHYASGSRSGKAIDRI